MGMSSGKLKPAVAFYRRRGGGTPAALPSERASVESFAALHGFTVTFEFVYAGASDEALFDSEAFNAMLECIGAKSAATVIVASDTTFSLDPLVQSVGAAQFRRHGISLIAAETSDAQAITTSPEQIVDHVFELRERFEAHLARMEARRRLKFGPQRRKNYVEMFPEAVSLAKSIHERSLRDGVRTSLREMSAMLAQQGHFNNAGKPYHPDEVRRMIKGPDPLCAA